MAEDLQSKAAEMMKKVLTVGIGTYFLTEESLKSLVSEFKLPKEILSAVLESAHKSKGEFLRSISKEIMDRVMQKVDPTSLLEEILAKNEVELQIKINFKPKHKGTHSSDSGT
jgi:hypothetical protein